MAAPGRAIATTAAARNPARSSQYDARATEAEARQRLAAQLPIAEKVKRADYVIRTDGTFEDTNDQVRRVFEQLQADAARGY